VWKAELEDTDKSFIKDKLGPRGIDSFSARVVNPWIEKTVTVDTVDKFKRKLSEFGYVLEYGSGPETDSSILNHSKLLLFYAMLNGQIIHKYILGKTHLLYQQPAEWYYFPNSRMFDMDFF